MRIYFYIQATISCTLLPNNTTQSSRHLPKQRGVTARSLTHTLCRLDTHTHTHTQRYTHTHIHTRTLGHDCMRSERGGSSVAELQLVCPTVSLPHLLPHLPPLSPPTLPSLLCPQPLQPTLRPCA